MRSTDLLLYFPLSLEMIFAPQKIRALEQWRSGTVEGTTISIKSDLAPQRPCSQPGCLPL